MCIFPRKLLAILENSIFINNTDPNGPDDIAGGPRPGVLFSPGSAYNLIGVDETGILINGVNGNQVGVTNAGLGPLASNGGPTQTMALLPGSPAIDAGGPATTLAAAISDTTSTTITVADAAAIDGTGGDFLIQIDSEQMLVTSVGLANNTLSVERGQNGTSPAMHEINAGVYLAIATDQRGALRGPAGLNAGSVNDIGAYEAGSSYLVTTTADSTDAGTLQAAVGWANVSTNANPAAAANPAPNTIVLAAAGDYVLSAPDLQALDSDLAAISSAEVTAGAPISITIDLGPAVYQNLAGSGTTAPIVVSAPTGVALTLNGPTSGTAILYDLQTSGTVTLQGNILVNGDSPALVVKSGVTTVADGVTLVTATSAPTIQVNGGTLVVRDSTIEQTSTTASAPAIQVNSGGVDLGTASSPGGNVLDVQGTGGFIQDSTSVPVSDEGNTLEVNAAPLPSTHLSLTALSSSASSTTYGQSVTLTAAVAAADLSDGTPTGSVEFVDTTTGADLGIVPLSGGVARFVTATLTAASHAITAEYLGNSTFAFSVNAFTQAVGPAPLTVTANPATKVYGQSNPTLSASYAGFVLGQGPSVLTAPPKLSTTATATSPVGTYTITVGGAVDPNYSISYVKGTLTVNPDPTTTTATASPGTALVGQAVTFTATVTANAPGSGTPTGTIDFYDTSTSTDLTPGGVAVSSGTAAFSTTSLAAGSHAIKASYSGDGNFLTSSGTAGTVAIGQTIFVLDPSAGGALSLSGSASIKITGTLVVDSSSSTAIAATGAASVTAPGGVLVEGGVSTSGSARVTKTGAPSSTANPLANLPEPTASGTPVAVNLGGNSSMTINPGVYSQINVSGSGKLTMTSGIYIIEGGGFSVSGAGTVTSTGAGVLIVNGGSVYPKSGGSYGGITLSGSGSYNLTPMSSGTYAGVLVFQPPDNSKAITVSGAASGMTGTIDAPAAALTVSGSGQIGTSLIVDTMTVSGAGVANAMTLSAPSGTIAYSPDQIRTAYGISSLPLDGNGQTIAIVDAYDDPDIDQALDDFDAEFDLTGPASSFLSVLNQDGQATGLPGTDPSGPGGTNWEVEEDLDVEWTHAIAPGAQIILVEADSQSLSDLMSAVATAAAEPGVSVVSMSWGFPEGQSVLAADEARYDQVFDVPGVTFVASTGDYGAADPEYPAFSPNVVAVGGTSLNLASDGSYDGETGWGSVSSSTGTPIASGGGISLYEPEPTFQQGVQSTGFRTTPDVSMVADPDTGAWIADPYNLDPTDPFEVVGGTSLSAPAWAGLIALVDQGRAAAGESPLNASDPSETLQALYSLPQSSYNVITTGDNGYHANAGYNLVTGLGTPIAGTLVPDLVAYHGLGTAYDGPTVAPLQDATLHDVGTGGGGTADVFSVFAAVKPSGTRAFAPSLAARNAPAQVVGLTRLRPGPEVRVAIQTFGSTVVASPITPLGNETPAGPAISRTSASHHPYATTVVAAPPAVNQEILVDAAIDGLGALSFLDSDGAIDPRRFRGASPS